MKTYPSIPRKVILDLPVIGFDKIDGSNVRAEWNARNGWYKFGTRTQLVDDSHPIFNEIPGLVIKHGTPIAEIFKKLKWERGMAFFEFHGKNSAFGEHFDEPHTLTLIDVNCHKRGILGPEEFIAEFANTCPTPPVFFKGKLTLPVVDAIRGMGEEATSWLKEGVVFKQSGVTWNPWMFKVKTDKWIEEAKRRFSESPEILESML